MDSRVKSSTEKPSDISEGQLFGVLRVTGEVNVKPSVGRKIRQSKSNMNQLTLSLDYTWNEKGMIKKKKREVGKTKRKNELMLN